MARAIKITSVSGALTVTITGPNGGTPTVYADSQLVNTLVMPATVADTATTTFWLPGPGKYTLSVKTSGGTEIAGDNNATRSVDLETDSSVAALNYDARTLATVAGDTGHSTAGGSAASSPFSTTVGNGTNTTYTVTHNLGRTTVSVTVRETASGAIVYPTVVIVDANSITVTFAVAPATNFYTAVVG